ncbi:BMP family ABC transporter substrate-binding protein [soil metagenome]
MRNSKRFAAMAFVAAFGLVAAACGDDAKKSDTTTADTTGDTTADTTGDTTAPSDLKVGVAFDTGGRGDGTFNDSAGRGADQAKTDLGATVQELEATTEADRQPNLEALSAAGNNPIVAVGFAFGDALTIVAAANPDVTYAWVDGYLDLPNVKTLSFAAEQGSFLVGAAAALKCGCDHIGFIGGQEIDLIKAFEAGYTAGAKQINPNITVEVQYLGAAGDNAAWGSPDKAKEIALGWYNTKGVEVIYSAAGGSGQGTIDAAVEADKWAIGVDSDQYLTATPEQQAHILTSMLKRVDNAVFQTIKAVQDGDISGGFKLFDLSVDGVGYSTSGGYLDEFASQLDDLKAQIIAGDIVVPTAP